MPHQVRSLELQADHCMNELGKPLFVFGLVVAIVGLMFWTGFGKGWLGRLPGDAHYSKGNFIFGPDQEKLRSMVATNGRTNRRTKCFICSLPPLRVNRRPIA